MSSPSATEAVAGTPARTLQGSPPNEIESDDVMHHLCHVRGARRFVLLARDSLPEANLVWKDTVRSAGKTVGSVLDVTSPVGRWIAHCHVPSTSESGMMPSFDMLPAHAV